MITLSPPNKGTMYYILFETTNINHNEYTYDIKKIKDYKKKKTKNKKTHNQLLSVQLLRRVSLQLHELQHARPPSPSPTPRAYSNSCP